MSYIINAACGCNMGKVRKNNEDNFCFANKILPLQNRGMNYVFSQKVDLSSFPLFAVFDGMGGEDYGEVASYTAAQTAAKHARLTETYLVSPREFLKELCEKTNSAVCEKGTELASEYMGTTLAALLFTEDFAYICNLGDSRIYRIRDNEIMQLSHDDVEPEAIYPYKKPRLTQHLGIPETELLLQPHIGKTSVKKGDTFLICSDGLTDMLSNVEICSVAKNHASAKQTVADLITNALNNGGRDNVAVIVCKIV